MWGIIVAHNDDLKWLIDQSMTVGELVDLLSKYPEDMIVLTTWESTVNSLLKREIYVSHDGYLYIDADSGSYKKDFARDPMENE